MMTLVEFVNESGTRVYLKEKRSSRFMKFLGACLGALRWFGANVVSRDDFMNHYVTTIRRTIYHGERWPSGLEVTTLVVHELCHIFQFLRFWMPLLYLLSQKWRMYFESVCVQAEILCFPDIDRGDAWMERRVRQFMGYMVKEHIVRKALEDRIREVKENSPQPEAKRIYEIFVSYQNQS